MLMGCFRGVGGTRECVVDGEVEVESGRPCFGLEGGLEISLATAIIASGVYVTVGGSKMVGASLKAVDLSGDSSWAFPNTYGKLKSFCASLFVTSVGVVATGGGLAFAYAVMDMKQC